MKRPPIKIFLLLVLTLVLGIWFGRPRVQAQTGEKKDLTCSLKSEVPVGQVTDQLISTDQSTAVKILNAVSEMTSFSGQAIKNAQRVVDLEDSCQASNCSSNCQQEWVQKGGLPDLTDSSICKDGFDCRHYSPEVFVQAQQDNDPNIPSLGCENLPDGQVGTIKDHWYEIVSWAENAVGNTCDSSPQCPPGYTCSLQQKGVTGKTGNWMMCGNPFTWQTADPGAVYDAYKVYPDNVSCLVKCVDLTGASGECNIDWSELACVANPSTCTGQACDFASINAAADQVEQSKAKVNQSWQKIDDIFHKGVYNLPFLGNYCDIPILGKFCLPNCWVAGFFGGNADLCPTELSTILKLHERSLANINNCQTNPQSFFEDKGGKVLLRCEELLPDILKKCYPKNFYCCQ